MKPHPTLTCPAPHTRGEPGTHVGFIHAQVTFENPFMKRRIETRALVDTGCLHLILPESVAKGLGFDPSEFSTWTVTLADGSQRNVPRVGPVRIHFAGRWADLTALVLGDEPLFGSLALEALDLSVHPATQTITVNLTSPVLGFRMSE